MNLTQLFHQGHNTSYIHYLEIYPTYLSISIPDPLIELLALENEEVVSRFEYAALDGDGARRVHIVSRHHADCDACLLTFPDGFGYLGERFIIIY